MAATVTMSLYNRNDMLVGGILTHLFCLPVLKRDRHQLALRAAVMVRPRAFSWTRTQRRVEHEKESAAVVPAVTQLT